MFPKKGQRESATDNSGCCAIYKQYVNSKNAVFLKKNTVFFYSTIFYFIYFNVVKNYIISSKSAPRKKGLRSFSIRGNCRGPPLVLRFLKFENEGGGMYHIGIDIGSSFTKYCVMNEQGEVIRLFTEQTPVRQREYFEEKTAAFGRKYPGCRIVTCGYGKGNVAAAAGNISELTALACGAGHYIGGSAVVLDVGGQDTKIVYEESGKLKKFFVNDKCAAGCGRFLINTLNTIKMPWENLNVSGCGKPNVTLSSVCAVFAQSEIVELLAQDYPAEGILQAVLWHILGQARVLLGKIDCTDIYFSGGLTKINGMRDYAELALGVKVNILDQSPYLSAIGCAKMM